MSKLHFTPEELSGRIEPQEMGLFYTSVEMLEITGEVKITSGTEEVCLVVLAGEVSYSYDKDAGRAVKKDMLYLPVNFSLTLSSKQATVVRFGAPCDRKTRFSHLSFAEVDKSGRHKVYGKVEDGTRRDVWNYIDEQFDSSRFLIGICKGADGGWTAWPPHKHGDKREEVYVYFDMGDSFGVQLVYDELDRPHEVALVRDGHVIAIPDGYHPNCGCPKGGISYVYCMVSKKAEDRNFMDLTTQKIFGDRLE